MNENQNLWDEKSKNYPKFEGSLSEFGKILFAKFDEFSINFTDKNIIDIGCGTGVYSLYLANLAKFVTCVDGSKNMLKILNNSAKKFKISNIKTIFSDFASFAPPQIYDIAFLTMSPSLKNESDFEKFMNLAKERIYLNWNKTRKSNIIDIFVKHDKSKIHAVHSFENFLQNAKIPYKSAILEERKQNVKKIDEMYENISWHLRINKQNLDENFIKKELLSLADTNGNIYENLECSMKLLVF